MLPKTRRAELEAELLKTMDQLDMIRFQLKAASADFREQLSLHEKKLRDIREVLSGRQSEQTSIPGSETGPVKPAAARPKPSRPRCVHCGSTTNAFVKGTDVCRDCHGDGHG